MMEQLTDIEKGLVAKALEAMDALKIPDNFSGEKYIPRKREFLEMIGITQEEILDTDIYPMFYEGPNNERGHSIRVAIMGMCISKFLRFNKDARVANYILGVSHDDGKLKVKEFYPENNPYTPKSKKHYEYIEQFKRGHVALENIPMHWGTMNASAIESSHRHQRGNFRTGPYPEKLALPQTIESLFLSQILAVPDFLDAVASRPCRITGKYPSPKEIISITLKEYGNMKIIYDGDLFPKTNIKGEELIYKLQRAGFAGKERPGNISVEDFRMNPFNEIKIR